MALTQQGATYERRSHFSKDQHLQAAFDDLASQAAAIRNQLQVGKDGVSPSPEAPTFLFVTILQGAYTVTITHDSPLGTRWRLEYSTQSNFSNAIPVDLGEVKVWQAYLPNQQLYFRAAAKFLASDLSPWTYFGSSASPVAT